LKDFNEQALMVITDGLTRDSPTLSGVLGPITGVGNAGAYPEYQKWPVSEDSQGSPDG
jgi:hypothetical protein